MPTNHGHYLIGRVDSLPDESLNGLARDVALAARAPELFTRARFAAIWRLNSGYYADLDLSKYQDRSNKVPLSTEELRRQ